ncbi:TonB-dependent receptor [Bacteroides uniformis]|uniref:TonB-dependent receptor n=1 Tax=Bacteroides uniformis TaxID=820 RepID=A0A7J5GTH5_BACUN|nr:TonB-dependent receptor [Bacteroides uniformis]KAB4180827.1 TonB-dependent receptor [Bacteroides uniformis]
MGTYWSQNALTRCPKGLCLLLLLIAGIFPLASHAQNAGININLTDKPLSAFIQSIEQQTDFKFFYEQQQVDVKQHVTVNVRNASINAALEQALRNTNIAYSISEKRILLTQKQDNAPSQSGKVILAKGQVTDKNSIPVIGANILVKGSTLGCITDIDGNYSLEVPTGSILVVSYIGYTTQEVTLKNNKFRQIVLEEDSKMLDDVVVVGYGTVKKRDLTGSVSSVKGDDLNLNGVSSIGHALEGKAAGLYIRQNSAQPGGGLDILVRGAGSVNASNDPLYIVDGFPIAKLDQASGGDAKMDPGTQGILNFLNPNDVESIEVLKDASATSIYGARAANGVVIITTKRGKEGKARVNYSYNYSFQKYTDNYDLLSLQEWMVEKNSTTWESWLWNNNVSPWGNRTLEEAQANPANGVAYSRPYSDNDIAGAGPGTDWLGLITRDGQIQEHNVNLQGGSESTQYMVSFNYYDHQGIVKNSGMTRYTAKANIDQKFLNIFKAGLNLTLTRIDNDNTQLGSGQFENSGIIRSAIQMGPNIQAYDEATGTYPINPLLGQQPNPYSLLNNTDKGRTDRLLGNIFIEAKPIAGLTLRVNAGLDHANVDRKTYQPRSTLNGKNLNGVAYIYNTDNNQYLMEATATYQRTFADIHSINLLAGTSYEKFNYDASELGNNNFITDAFLWNNMDAGTGTKITKSTSTENKMMSYFFRAGYILKNRYLLTATLRADGASVFAKNNKWGYFPSVAAGWTMSEENFMRNIDWLSNLKLRLSWGQTGNADISTNAFASYGAQGSWINSDYKTVSGVMKSRLENPDLKWETTTEWNLGLDFGFLKSRITGSVELYQRVISDLLNYKPLNTYQEVKQVMANIGKTQSRGIEVTLNTRNIVTKDFFWETSLTYTKYKDRWKERTPDWKPNVYEKETDPIRAIYSRRADHIMQIGEEAPTAQPDLRPGQIVIKDLDGYVRDENGNPKVDENGRFMLLGRPDGIIDEADTELIGTLDPGWMASMTNTFKYKGFDLNIMFNGMFDRIMQDPTEMDFGVNGGGIAQSGYNMLRTIKDRWTFDNPSTTRPSSYYITGTNYTAGDFFYQKAWFIRLQNISLGYTLPKSLLAKTKVLSNVRFHASVNNLFVITPYKGLDPETDAYAAAYPNARTLSFGVDVSF